MTLTKELNRYIYANGVEDVIQQGKKIYQNGCVFLQNQYDEDVRAITLKIKDNVYNVHYLVHIKNYHDMDAIFARCNCVHQKRNVCKHKIAALFYLKDLLEANVLSVSRVTYDQSRTVLKMGFIDMKQMKSLVSTQVFRGAEQLIRSQKAKIEVCKHGSIRTDIKDGPNVFRVAIFLNDNEEMVTECNCDQTQFIVCKHKVAVFLQVLYGYGVYYFSTLRTRAEAQKEVSQKEYREKGDAEVGRSRPVVPGFSPKDKAAMPTTVTKSATVLSHENLEKLKSQIQTVRTAYHIDQIVFRENIRHYPHYDIFVQVKGELHDIYFPQLYRQLKNAADKALVKSLQKLTYTQFVASLSVKKHLFHGHITEESRYKNFQTMPEEIHAVCYEYFCRRFQNFSAQVCGGRELLWEAAGAKKGQPNVVTFAQERVEPFFCIERKDQLVSITTKVPVKNKLVDKEENQFPCDYVFLYDNILYSWRDNYYDVFSLVKRVNERKITQNQWNQVARKELQMLFQYYDFEIDPQLCTIIDAPIGRTFLRIRETDVYLHMQLCFVYDGHTVHYDKHRYIYVQERESVQLLRRDTQKETELYDKVGALHTRWIKNKTNSQAYQFTLAKEEALKDKWFLQFLETMSEENIQVMDLDQLKKISVREQTPTVRLDVQSSIDWLDVKVNIQIESEKVDLEQIYKMFRNNGKLLITNSGKVVSISNEWVRKYKLLFYLSEKKGKEKLRFHKSQALLVQAITQDETQNDYLQVNWNKQARDFLDIPMDRTISPPDHLRDIIKNYQKESFYWFQHLKKLNYNGLLGDDMGLGKTLQVLTNLAYEKQSNGRINALVICPTSLIYTWQEEVKKFTPELSLLIYHNSQRIAEANKMRDYDVVITTYGIVRSDILLFRKMEFDYIVLDESQYIKNPNSKIYHTVVSLQAKNKICLSGTPLQNNTLDLYAQINFLNPNFLGSRSFFQNYFSIPIDRYDDKEIKLILRNAVSMLFLRRTKQEVSPELPDKKVNILYCVMPEKQRQVYEAYRTKFQENLLSSVMREGIDQYKGHILHALTKLRMICNSPVLVDKDAGYPNVSIKCDLLIERIQVNVAEHKVAVFSQFLGMLSILKKSLQKVNIPFEYLDGSKGVKDREAAVKKFQEDDECRVFLISLKAGGIGLNLTAADYVYIVDPWWNPTIEMQAIDRTHRIGQMKKIFAQRMICKDTIEEKIITLQRRKSNLSRAIIEKPEESFLRDMTEEDLAYLLE